MRNYFSFHILIILILGICISCDHTSGKKHITTYGFSQELKDYTVFNAGSYWVYEDSASKMRDSIYLFDQKYSFIEDAGGTQKYQHLEEWKHSSIGPTTLLFEAYIPSGQTTGVYAESKPPISSPLANYFDGNVGTLSPYSGITIYDAKINTINFKKTFYDVKVFLNLQQMYPNHEKRVYYAKNIGLVRKELFNGQVWNLIRYHVAQ